MIAALILAGVALAVLYAYLTWNHRHWQKLGVACDDPSVLFGNVRGSLLMMKNRAEEIDEIYMKYPGEKVVGMYNLRRPCLVVRDPDLVRKVLVTDFHYFRNNDMESEVTDDPVSRNIFVLKDEEWKRSRALITPAFTGGKIKAVFPQMLEIGKDFAEYLREHPEELHIKDTMSRYTTEVIAKCAFGIEANAFKDDKSEIFEVGRSMFKPSMTNQFFMMILFFFPQLNRIFRFRFIPKNVTDFFQSILKDVIVYRQENSVERNDLVQYLIELKRKTIEVEKGNIKSDLITRGLYDRMQGVHEYTPKAYTDDDVLAGCVMFFIEAYETSALLTSHILYQLAKHPEIQDKLRQEIDEEMSKGSLTFDQVSEMPYLNAVILETNRTLPVTHFLFKKCTENYEMNVGKEKPLPIAKDTSIVIPLYGLHMDPLYWEEPDKFKPERFSEKDTAKDAKSKAVFMPFGDGPRMCIGMRIATTMIKVALINIVHKLEVFPSSKTPKKIELDPLYFMTTHKGGIHLRFAERSR